MCAASCADEDEEGEGGEEDGGEEEEVGEEEVGSGIVVLWRVGSGIKLCMSTSSQVCVRVCVCDNDTVCV